MAKMIQLSGMWVNYTKQGEQYLSGYLGNARILMFKNKYAGENDKAPQWILYVTENETKDSKGSDADDLE